MIVMFKVENFFFNSSKHSMQILRITREYYRNFLILRNKDCVEFLLFDRHNHVNWARCVLKLLFLSTRH